MQEVMSFAGNVSANAHEEHNGAWALQAAPHTLTCLQVDQEKRAFQQRDLHVAQYARL